MRAGTDGLMHFKNYCIRSLILTALALNTVNVLVAQEPLRFMFYNVENLFDIYDDSLVDDEEFLPSGLRRWNYSRYSTKLNSLYKVITAAGEWSPPALVSFCEVENRRVIEDLINKTYLSRYEWGIVHEDSPDERGIDVCMIYRKDLLNLLGYDFRMPSEVRKEDFSTRTVLHAWFSVGDDTLHFIINHWPSRRGGVLAGEELRLSLSRMVKELTDSLQRVNDSKVKFIIAGDFNCNPDDPAIKMFSGENKLNNDSSSSEIVNLAEDYLSSSVGTYRYNGIWEIFDQIMVSGWLLKSTSGFYTKKPMFRIFRPDFLLWKDPRFPGYSPFSTYRGYRYQGGFSDHLPVILDFQQRK